MKKTILLLIIFFSFANSILGQENTEELNQYKKFLPYIIKGIQDSNKKTTPKKTDSRVIGVFKKPWEVEKLNEETIKETITSIIKNYSLNIEQDYRKKWNLDFSSTINKNSALEDTSNSDYILSNTYISISEIKLFDNNNISVIEKKERKIKINQSTDIEFHSAGVNIDFPLQKEYKNIKGSIKLTLKEFQTIDYKELKRSDKDILFDLGDYKGIKLLKIEKNKAYFYLPTPIENIKITSTNKKNKKFAENALMPLAKNIYDFSMREDLSKNLIESFIEKLSLDDIKDKPQVLMYQTNGTIDNLYIYLKSNPKKLTSKTLPIKL